MQDITAEEAGFVVSGKRGITLLVPAVPLTMPPVARQMINDLTISTIRLALHELAGHVSDEAPVDSGGLAQSFGADPANSSGGMELMGVDVVTGVEGRVFSALPHAVVMDQGRRPGAPISREGIEAIGLWAQRKLGMSPDEAKGAKFAIANAIVKRGLPAKQFAEKGLQSARPRIEVMLSVLGDSIGRALTTPRGQITSRPV